MQGLSHIKEGDHVIIYTDGACSGNPGPGGWGAVVMLEGAETADLFGGDPQTTNNRMEMMAAIEALKALPKGCKVDLYTDSQYVKDGITLWLAKWEINGWVTAAKKPVKNQDLWEELNKLIHQHQVTWHWVRGHDGNLWNEKADALARSAIITQRMRSMA